MLDKRFHQYGIQPKISLESVSTQALLEFCLHGQGVLFLPKAQRSIILLRGNYWRSMLQMQNSKDITILSIIRKNI